MSDEIEWVTMFHPQTEGVAEASVQAFDRVWKDKGWQRMDRAEADLMGLKGERLKELAAERDVDITGLKAKKDIVQALKGATTNG